VRDFYRPAWPDILWEKPVSIKAGVIRRGVRMGAYARRGVEGRKKKFRLKVSLVGTQARLKNGLMCKKGKARS